MQLPCCGKYEFALSSNFLHFSLSCNLNFTVLHINVHAKLYQMQVLWKSTMGRLLSCSHASMSEKRNNLENYAKLLQSDENYVIQICGVMKNM